MSLTDAQTAQGMATRHRRSVKAVVQGIGHINALLRKMIQNNQIKWGGYGTKFDWYVRKLDETAEWSSGQLGSRSFEEKDPIAKAQLDYCFIDRTYGISEASIKTNRAAGAEKIYDIQKENARVAQSAIYRAFTTALYSNSTGSVASGPAGLRTITGNPAESSNAISITAALTYAGQVCTSQTSNITAYGAGKLYYQNKWWASEAAALYEIATALGLTTNWSACPHEALAWMTTAMSRTQDISGTGKVIRPDLALMNIDPYNALWAKEIGYKGAAGPITLTDADFDNVGIKNIRVGTVTCVYDENVPADSGSLEIVFVLDSSAFVLETLNTKAEGLIEGEWKTDDPEIVGGIGVYKGNLGIRVDSPVSVGAIVGCNS